VALSGLNSKKCYSQALNKASGLSGRCFYATLLWHARQCSLSSKEFCTSIWSRSVIPVIILRPPNSLIRLIHASLFVCNHIAFGCWRPWHIQYTFPHRFFRNVKKQKQSRKSSSPKNKRNRQKKQHQLLHPPITRLLVI